jgi:hypothetical protein
MVIVIVFAFAMIAITLFMPTYMENFEESDGVGKVFTIDSLTRDKIINMTLGDLYVNIFKPLRNPNLTVNEFYENANKCMDKLTELAKTDQLTEEDINSLITTKIIQVNPTDTHKEIAATLESLMTWSGKHNTELQAANKSVMGEEFKRKSMNIFTSQKTNYAQVLMMVMQISSYKFATADKNAYIVNPFTGQPIDKITGLPITTTTTTTTPPASAVSSNNTPAATAATVTSNNTPETNKPCSTYDGKRDECIRHKYKRNCEYIDDKKHCRQMKM